jgi:hypothetical protein
MGKPPQFSARYERRLEEWQFLLLRFAITRDTIDRATAESAARQLDAVALAHTASFTYFLRTTTDVCSAIADPRAQHGKLILQAFVSRVHRGAARKLNSSRVEPSVRFAHKSVKSCFA